MTLHFKDGTSATADVAIGADGVHSKVRDYLIGEEAGKPVFSGAVVYRGLVPMDSAVEVLGSEHAQNGFLLCGPGTIPLGPIVSKFPRLTIGQTRSPSATPSTLGKHSTSPPSPSVTKSGLMRTGLCRLNTESLLPYSKGGVNRHKVSSRYISYAPLNITLLKPPSSSSSSIAPPTPPGASSTALSYPSSTKATSQ